MTVQTVTESRPMNQRERHMTKELAAHFLREVATAIEQGNRILLKDKFDKALEFCYRAEPTLAPPTPTDLALQLMTSANELPIIAEGLHRGDNRLRNLPVSDTLELVPGRKPFFYERAAMALRLCDLPTVERIPTAISRAIVMLLCAEHRREDVLSLINDEDVPGVTDLELQIGDLALDALMRVLKGVERPATSPKVLEFPGGAA